MHKIFVSYKFREQDQKYAGYIKDLVSSHGLEAVTGEDLGGEPLYSEISKRIDACEGLISLVTLPDDTRHFQFVLNELTRASALGKRVFALIDKEYPYSNPEGREYGPLDLAKPLEAFLKLSRTLGIWRKDAGRRVLIHLEPKDIARLAEKEDKYRCRYRFRKGPNPISDWKFAKSVVKVYGRYEFEAEGLTDESRIEVEVFGQTRYKSEATDERITVTLEQDE